MRPLSTSTGATRRRRSWRPTPAPRASRPRGTPPSRRDRRPRCASVCSQSGACCGTALCQKPGLSTPSGKRCMLTGRSARYGSIAGATVALWRMRSRLVIAVVRPLRREQHLVEVRQLQGAARRAPTCPCCRARRARRARRRSAPPRSRSSTTWPPAPPSPRRWCDPTSPTRVVLRVPSGDGVLVVLVQQQPLLLAASSPPRRTSAKCPRNFSPNESKCRSPASVAGDRIGVVADRPGAPVPHDDVAAAVLAAWG